MQAILAELSVILRHHLLDMNADLLRCPKLDWPHAEAYLSREHGIQSVAAAARRAA